MKYLVGIISVLVVVVLVGSVMVPIINDSTGGGVEYEDNPDWDGWVRFDLNTSAGATYHLGMSQDDNGIYVENIAEDSRDTQIYDDSTTVDYPTIMYADSNTVIWSIDDTFSVMGKINGSPVYLSGTILDVTRSADGVEVVTENDSAVFDAPTWAYVPLSQGKYGFYPYNEERGVEHPANAPTAVLGGGNVGVWAYNNSYRYDGLGLVMNPIVDGGLYYGATWEKQSADTGEFNLDDTTITPLDPSIISGGDDTGIVIDDPLEPDAELMSMPTPTYTDGDWGYDLTTIDGIQKAIIVSYSGAGGNIVVPSKINGYDVIRVGKTNWDASSGSNYVLNNSSISANSILTFEDGIIDVGAFAFQSCSNISAINLPDSIIHIGNGAFMQTSITSLELPKNLTDIGTDGNQGSGSFAYAPITGKLVLPDSLKVIGRATFRNAQITSVEFGNGLIELGQGAFLGCSSLSGTIAFPGSLQTLVGAGASSGSTFGGVSGVDTVVLPDSVTTLGNYVFIGLTGLNALIVASETVPGSGYFSYNTGITDVLDLSDTIDYSIDRYGIPATATVYDSIGDCFGFISAVSIAHNVPGAMGQYSNLVYVIPIVIIASLLVAFAAFITRRDY